MCYIARVCGAYRAVQACKSRHIDDERMDERRRAVGGPRIAPLMREPRDERLQIVDFVLTQRCRPQNKSPNRSREPEHTFHGFVPSAADHRILRLLFAVPFACRAHLAPHRQPRGRERVVCVRASGSGVH